jgi:hypothetical protein
VERTRSTQSQNLRATDRCGALIVSSQATSALRGSSLSPPAWRATALLRRCATATPARHQHATRQEPGEQRAHAARQAPGLAQARVGRRSRAAVPHDPPTPSRAARTWTLVNLHGLEGALEQRASGALGVLKRAGGVVPAGSAQQGAAPAVRNRPTRRLEAGGRAAWWARCGGVVVGGGGRTRRRSAGRGGGGGYAKRRCGRGAGREGAGCVPCGARW